MKVTVFGTGYVGLVQGAVLADVGHDVVCVDVDAAKVAAKANRAEVDEDDAKGVAELRARGMTVIDNIDRNQFAAALAPANAQFEKEFGKAAMDRIRAVK